MTRDAGAGNASKIVVFSATKFHNDAIFFHGVSMQGGTSSEVAAASTLDPPSGLPRKTDKQAL